MKVILDEDYTLVHHHNIVGFGTKDYIVKLSYNNKEIVERLVEDPDTTISKYIQRANRRGVGYEVKILRGRMRILRRQWNPQKEVERYGIIFKPNHYNRTYTYIDKWQRIDLQGKFLYVYDEFGATRYYIMDKKRKISTKKPFWWNTYPHHHLTFAELPHNPKIKSITKSYPLVKYIEGDYVTYKNIPFADGLYNVTAPLDEIFFIDTQVSVENLPSHARIEKTFELPFSIDPRMILYLEYHHNLNQYWVTFGTKRKFLIKYRIDEGELEIFEIKNNKKPYSAYKIKDDLEKILLSIAHDKDTFETVMNLL